MVSIYLIEDLNDLKYVGSTTQELNRRFSRHMSAKRTGRYCSSSKLNLDNCIITQLERCNKEDRKERERYWINKIDCVNQIKLNFDQKEYNEKNKEKKKEWSKEYMKEYREKNKETIKEYGKLDWFCSDCKCNVKRCHKARHLKSKKHQLNTNNYLSQ